MATSALPKNWNSMTFDAKVSFFLDQGYSDHEALMAARLESGDTLDPEARDAFVGDDD